MSELSFGFPIGLVMLPLVIVSWAMWMWGTARSGHARSGLTRRPTPRRPVAVPMLLAAAALFSGFAAAQPRWGSGDTAVERPAGNIVVAFDVSRSMDAQDITPSRLQVAREAVADSMMRLNGDRVGLVIFAGTARLRFPLTTDMGAASSIVRSLETGTFLVGRGTSTAGALELAIETLGGDGIVVLVTDGDDPSASAVTAAQMFAESGVELLIVPVGTAEGATIPIFNGSSGAYQPLTSSDGVAVVTQLDEPFLMALAEAAEGTLLGGGVESLPGELSTAANNLRRSSFTTDATIPIERFQWFALPAVLLALVALAWGSLPLRRLAPAAGVVLIALLTACATEAHQLNADALAALDAGDVDGAVTLLYEAAAERPDDAEIAFNLSTALHAAGRYQEAIDAATRMERSPHASVRARAQSLLGHHWFALGALDQSLNAFRQVLLLDNENETARHDYEVVYALLNEEQSEPSDSSQDGGGDQPSDPGDGDGTAPTTGGPGGNGEEQPAPRVRPAGQDELEEQLAKVDRAIEALIDDSGDRVSAEEALEILDLIEERAKLAALRDGLRGFNATDH